MVWECACTPGKTTVVAPEVHDVRSDRKFNDSARFLAGLPGNDGSPYAGLERTEAWKEYAANFQKSFGSSDARLLKPVREFSAKEMPGAAKGGFVYYPFGGPDVLYVQAFYPDAKTYMLCGLEKPGSVWDVTHISVLSRACESPGCSSASISIGV